MQFRVVTYGATTAAANLAQMGANAINARPAFEEIYLTMLDIEDEMFERQGARGQPRWTPLGYRQIVDKRRKGQDPRTLIATGLLRASVTTYRHPMQYTRIERDKIVFGSQRPFAKVHQKGQKQGRDAAFNTDIFGNLIPRSGGVPQRKFIHFTEQDENAFAREILRHVVRPVKGTVGRFVR